jgi:hypothetical protein
MSKIFDLVSHSENARHWSPEDALTDALRCIKENDGAFNKDLKKVLIIAIDDNMDDYNIGFIQAGMKMSECLAACNIAQAKFRKYMGY